jgi:CRP/FNR family nitrogen fixation transcriptional regulator
MVTDSKADQKRERPRPGHLHSVWSDDACWKAVSYAKHETIYREGQAAELIYTVIDGAVINYKHLPDGRRQIIAFHLAGNIFGMENGEHYRFSAEALVNTTVGVTKRDRLQQMTRSDQSVLHDVLEMTTASLQHAEDQLLLLGRQNSLERVAAFLCEMHQRMPPAHTMTLPMSRHDIADYLGIELETVSRALSELQRRGLLKFEGATHRKIVVLDPTALAELNQ